MSLPILLSVLGLILVFLEFFLPSGLIAVLGAVALVSGVTYFSVFDVPLYFKALYFLMTAVGCIFACKLAIWTIRRRRNSDFLLKSSHTKEHLSEIENLIAGKLGTAYSDLKPSGYISVEGKRFQALSDGNYILKGAEIVVLEQRGNAYLVKEKI